MGYDPETKMSSLQSCWISRASAEQRKGRAGRTGPGVCYRLYSTEIHSRLLPYSVPEIQRIPLESVGTRVCLVASAFIVCCFLLDWYIQIILQMIAMSVPNPLEFPFIERPSNDKLEASLFSLQQHQAITRSDEGTYRLTAVGGMLAQLPVDIPIGKMLVLGSLFHILDPVLTMAAALTVQSPFVTRGGFDPMARHEFDSPHGDAFTLLNLFDQWVRIKATKPRSSRGWCKAHGVEEQRMYEMAKLKDQFKDILAENGLLPRQNDENSDPSCRDHQRRRDIARKRREIRLLQRERESSRKRRVLRFDEEIEEQQQNEAAGEMVIDPINDEQRENKNKKVEEQEEVDIRELDFMLTHDLDKLSKDSARKLSLHDVNVLKVILASGLYPNMAIADELNPVRRDSDQLFHTRWKEFVILHPTSVFSVSQDPSQQISLSDTLAYVSLLETNKPYAVNITRCPALHTLLLFANTIDTTKDCTRLAVDNWLEFELNSSKTGERLLIVVHQLRLMMQNFLHHKLMKMRKKRRIPSSTKNSKRRAHVNRARERGEIKAGEEADLDQEDEKREQSVLPEVIGDVGEVADNEVYNMSFVPSPPPPDVAPAILRIHHESCNPSITCDVQQLVGKLAEFLDTTVSFKMSRIKPSEFHAMFFTVGSNVSDEHKAANQAKDVMQELEAIRAREHTDFESTKGGWRVNSYLRYGSLRQHKTIAAGFTGSHLRKHWRCDRCGGNFIFSLEDIATHQAACSSKMLQEKIKEQSHTEENKMPVEEPAKTTINIEWVCPTCHKRLNTSRFEILKHKKSH